MTLPTYLRSILSVVQNDLSPLLTSAYASHRAELIQMVLLRVIAELESKDAAGYWPTLFSALDRTVADFDGIPSDLRETLDLVREASGAQSESSSSLAARLSEALARVSPANASERAAVRQVAAAVAAAESLGRIDLEARIVAAKEELAARKTSSQELYLSEDVLTEYLRRRFPKEPDVRAQHVTPIPGGRSKGTILFDLVSSKRRESLVIRKDFAKDFMQCSVSDEYPLVRAAWAAGLPVPQPYWLEEDASVIDGKFIVFARVAGKPAGTMFEMKTSPQVVRQFAQALAKLHSIDIAAAKLTDALDFGRSQFPVRDMVFASYEKHKQHTATNVLLESAHVWLLNNLDCIDPRPVFIHGDAGFHNVLADGDRMTALLDWELAHAGDPAEDLTSCKALVETIMPWREFLDAYVDAGGRPISPERQHFFTVWKLVNYIMFADAARRMFEAGIDPDLRLAAIGYNTHNRLQSNLARVLAQPPA